MLQDTVKKSALLSSFNCCIHRCAYIGYFTTALNVIQSGFRAKMINFIITLFDIKKYLFLEPIVARITKLNTTLSIISYFNFHESNVQKAKSV